jgi:hypothetical protein
MKWILEHFQIVVIIVVAFVYWLKERLEAKMAERQMREELPDIDEPGEFHEPAVDMPSPSPPRPSGYERAVANEAAAAEKHRQKLAGHLRRIRETKANTTGDAAATRARVTAKDVKTATVAAPTRLRSRLRHPAEIRRAVVMREILDPPVGLR